MDTLYSVHYPDRNISPKDYANLQENEILVTGEPWKTLQGEGPFAGRRATFIRVSGCNRGIKSDSCAFCDSDFRFDNGQIYTVDMLVQQVRKLKANLVVLTGGEPMLQDNLMHLITVLYSLGYTVQIESNGDRLIKHYDRDMATLVVSPKVIPSTGHYKKLRDDVADALSYLKFVVDSRVQSPYSQLPSWAFNEDKFPRANIYISPLAVYTRAVREGEIASIWTEDLIDREQTAKNYAYAGFLCQAYNLTLSVQSHLFVGVA